MNLTWTVFFVVLAAGIHNVHTNNWDIDKKRLWTHYLKLIQTLQNNLIVLRRRADGTMFNDPAKAYEGIFVGAQSGRYVQFGRNLGALLKFTGDKLKFIIGTSEPLRKRNNAVVARAAIEQLIIDINNDSTLSDGYKYGCILLKGYLLGVYVSDFGGSTDHFAAICPQQNPFSQARVDCIIPESQDGSYVAITSNIRRSPPADADGSGSRNTRRRR